MGFRQSQASAGPHLGGLSGYFLSGWLAGLSER